MNQLERETQTANEEARRLDHERAARIEREAAVDLLVLLAVAVLFIVIAWAVAP